MLLTLLGLTYFLGAATWPFIGRMLRRIWRRLRGERHPGWSDYFEG
jgi:hypothetical protein